jgi:hypothetical protein
MSDRLIWDTEDEAAIRARIARCALRQAGRHERAIEACLAELAGTPSADLSLVAFVLRRARHHSDRARRLAAMAARIDPDPAAAPSLAAALERHERNALRVARWRAEGTLAEVSGEAA